MTKLSLPALQKSTMRATRESSDTTIKSEKTSVNISMLQSSSDLTFTLMMTVETSANVF